MKWAPALNRSPAAAPMTARARSSAAPACAAGSSRGHVDNKSLCRKPLSDGDKSFGTLLFNFFMEQIKNCLEGMIP
jgi:hypothetical protein